MGNRSKSDVVILNGVGLANGQGAIRRAVKVSPSEVVAAVAVQNHARVSDLSGRVSVDPRAVVGVRIQLGSRMHPLKLLRVSQVREPGPIILKARLYEKKVAGISFL